MSGRSPVSHSPILFVLCSLFAVGFMAAAAWYVLAALCVLVPVGAVVLYAKRR